MKIKSIHFIYAYVLVSIIHLFSILYPIESLEVITKLLLMPLLILFIYSESKSEINASIALLIGLFFSWIGDAVLIK